MPVNKFSDTFQEKTDAKNFAANRLAETVTSGSC